jgi:hypothetical protein
LEHLQQVPCQACEEDLSCCNERALAGEVKRLDENRARKIDTCIVAATHRDLEAMVRDKTFREDLYYRLNVVLITLPPLRERDNDVLLLGEHFLIENVVQRAVILAKGREIGVRGRWRARRDLLRGYPRRVALLLSCRKRSEGGRDRASVVQIT